MKTSVRASDLHSKIAIIGPLGKPLGQLMTLSGSIVRTRTKGDPTLFRVTHLEGKALGSPIELPYSVPAWLSIKTLKTARTLTLRAYQTGAMVGIPHDAMKETVFVQTTSFTFRTELVLLKEVP